MYLFPVKMVNSGKSDDGRGEGEGDRPPSFSWEMPMPNMKIEGGGENKKSINALSSPSSFLLIPSFSSEDFHSEKSYHHRRIERVTQSFLFPLKFSYRMRQGASPCALKREEACSPSSFFLMRRRFAAAAAAACAVPYVLVTVNLYACTNECA